MYLRDFCQVNINKNLSLYLYVYLRVFWVSFRFNDVMTLILLP